MENGQQKTLRGWKEIASYVGRDVRTVQRWEVRRGFPISRLPGGDGGNVYILAAEVDQWLHSSLKAQTFEDVAARSGEHIIAPISEQASNEATQMISSTAESPAEAAATNARTPRSFLSVGSGRYWARLGALAATLVVALLVSLRFHQRRVQARVGPVHDAEFAGHTIPRSDVDPLYLQGMYFFEKRTPEALLEAKRALLNVTVREPNEALAWSGLAEVGTLLYEYGIENDAGAPARVRAAADRALALDPGLAEPHAVRGFADFFWEANIRAAEPEFRTALQINPSSALARSWYGTFLTYEGRFPEALQQLNRAQLLEPSSTAILSNRALALGLSGHRDMATQLLEKAGGDGSIANVRFNLALLSLIKPCNMDVFLHEEMGLSAMSHNASSYRLFAAAQAAYRRGGETAMWRSILANSRNGPASPDLVAGAHAALGDNDAALQVLVEAEQKHGSIVDLGMHPLLLPLHSDPRFQQMLTALGLPPSS